MLPICYRMRLSNGGNQAVKGAAHVVIVDLIRNLVPAIHGCRIGSGMTSGNGLPRFARNDEELSIVEHGAHQRYAAFLQATCQ